MKILTILSVLQVYLTDAFDFSCPSQAHWNLRAQSMCMTHTNYSCLFDVNLQVNIYRDKCIRPRIVGPGYKYVFQPNPNRDICSLTRYQPFIFNTTGYSDCVFLKSQCTSRGQKTYTDGTTRSDRSCSCKQENGYNFVSSPQNECYCNPSSEDCSCCLGINQNNKTIGCKDVDTYTGINIYLSNLHGYSLNKSKALKNKVFDNFKYNLAGYTNANRTIAAVFVLILVVLYPLVAVGIYYRLESTKRIIHTNDLPKAISQLSEEDRIRYITLMEDSVHEKRYFVRIMIVGKEKVGKTSLLRRLLNERTDDVSSTDGVDIVIRRCKINVHDGEWTIENDVSDNSMHRIQRALIQNESLQNEPTIPNESAKNDVTEKCGSKHNSLESLNEHGLTNISNGNTQSSQLNPFVPIVDTINVDGTDARNISLHEGSNDANERHFNRQKVSIDSDVRGISLREVLEEDLNEKDNESEAVIKDYENKTITNSGTSLGVNKDESKSQSLEMPEDILSQIFSSTTNITSNHYALCGLWDFAGQKEFYATHQMFLTGSAIYLVVADMNSEIWKDNTDETKVSIDSTQDATHSFIDLQTDEAYMDFWFDSIHCYQSADLPVNEASNTSSEPPVIVVFTGADKYDKVNLEKRKRELETQLISATGKRSTYQHFRKCFYLSNIHSSDQDFDTLRESISETAKSMHNWGESVPLKWILLEHLIEINKNKGKNFITFDEMVSLSEHKEIDISDTNEVKLFLRVQHKVGNIIYFSNIPNLIILKPQWLVNAFRCLVSDKLAVNTLTDNRQTICSHWNELQKTGIISDLLITTLFELKGNNQFLEQKDDLLKVMKRFDILVEIEDTHTCIMPSMLPSSDFETVCKTIGVFKENCERTSWFCLKFEFLPPIFFNHLVAWLLKTYQPSKMEDERNSLALYKGICVFNFENNGCDKLLITMSTDIIAVQVLSFDIRQKNLSSLCTSVRKELENKIEDIKITYGLKLSYEKRLKCSAGRYDMNTISLEDLKSADYFQCLHHRSAHPSKMIYSTWTEDEEKPATTDVFDGTMKELDIFVTDHPIKENVINVGKEENFKFFKNHCKDWIKEIEVKYSDQKLEIHFGRQSVKICGTPKAVDIAKVEIKRHLKKLKNDIHVISKPGVDSLLIYQVQINDLVNPVEEDTKTIITVERYTGKKQASVMSVKEQASKHYRKLAIPGQFIKADNKKNGSVTFTIYGLSSQDIENAKKGLDRAVKEKYREEKHHDRNISTLFDSEIVHLKSIEGNYPIKITIDQVNSMVILEGIKDKVIHARQEVFDALRNFAHTRHCKEEALIIKEDVQWYFKDFDCMGLPQLFEYPDMISMFLETKYKGNSNLMEFKDDQGEEYVILLNEMKEYLKNDRSINVDVLRRKKVQEHGGKFEPPPEWDEHTGSENVKLVTLLNTSPEYKSVEQKFLNSVFSGRPELVSKFNKQTFKVTKIERVQNLSLYHMYAVKKALIDKQNTQGTNNEKELWHGTPESAVVSINLYGFNRSYCQDNSRDAYFGEGVYFSADASYSAKERLSKPSASGEHYIYMCKVLTGVSCQGKKGMRLLPNRTDGKFIQYDSATDTIYTPTVEYVIFDDTQAYPEYCIKFKY